MILAEELQTRDINQFVFDRYEPTRETIQEFWERKDRRIETSKRPTTVNLIKAVERTYENYYPDEACNKICRMLKTQVQSKVKFWSKKARYGGLRLYPDDFEEIFWEVIWGMVDKDYNSRSDFWLYENIFKKIDCKALDLIRWARRNCRKHSYTSISIDAMVDIPDPSTSRLEEIVLFKDTIVQMFGDPALSERELSLLYYLYEEPEASYQQIANAINLNHKETARRTLISLRVKLLKYYN